MRRRRHPLAPDLGAQAIGAGRAESLRAIARTGLKMNLVLTGALVVVGYLFSRQFMGMFITSEPAARCWCRPASPSSALP